MRISGRFRFSVLTLLVMTAVAQADPAAEALFQEGRDLMKSGKLDEACDRFTRSEALEPMVGTAFKLGECREHQGRLADAWEAFVTSHALAARANDTRGAVARERAATLEPKLAHLTIVIAGTRPAGLAITRNGAPVAPEALDIEIPLDPGTYELVAAAPGFHSRSTRVALELGAHATATIDALEAIAAPPPPHVSAPAPASVVAPSRQRLSVGAAFGGTSASDIAGGVRVVGSAPVPGGAVRATLQGLFNSVGLADPYQTLDHYKLGLGLDYLRSWGHGLATAGAFAVGKTWIDDSYQTLFSTNWIALEASPLIVQLGGSDLELGLHVMVILDETATETPNEASARVVGVLGLDWFVW